MNSMNLWNLKQALKNNHRNADMQRHVKTPIHPYSNAHEAHSGERRVCVWPLCGASAINGTRDVTKSGIFLHVIISGMPWFSTCLHFTKCFYMLRKQMTFCKYPLSLFVWSLFTYSCYHMFTYPLQNP